MKILIPASIRPYSYFAVGSRFFMLDAANLMGNTTESAAEMSRNFAQYGKSWAPANFVACTSTELCEGMFAFTSDKPWGDGAKNGTVGEHRASIVTADEMVWLKGVLTRLGVADYAGVKKAALAGDMEATIVIGYCESANQEALLQRFSGNRISYFEADQFIDAVVHCAT